MLRGVARRRGGVKCVEGRGDSKRNKEGGVVGEGSEVYEKL